MIFIICECLILVLMIKNIACAECPSIYDYSSSDGVYYAMMQVPFPDNHNNAIKFHIQLSIGAAVSDQNLDGKLQFLGTSEDIEQQKPLNFKLLWPTHLNDVKRIITQITVNNRKFCSSDRLDKKNFKSVTEINQSVIIKISTRIINNSETPSFTSPPVTNPPTQQPYIYFDTTTSTTSQPVTYPSGSSQCYTLSLSNLLIVGGSGAEIGDYPFLGALVKKKNSRAVTVLCGVTLITENLALTAGHCVQESSIEQLLILFGISDIDDNYNDNKAVRKINNYILHPDYNNSTSDADLAIFELSKKVEFSSAVHSACLCDFQDCFKDDQYQRGVVAGWGKNEDGVPSRTLKKIETSIVADAVCLWSAGEFYKITSNRTFCAGDRNGVGPCNGDSGSGFYMYLNGRWIIRGVVSRSLVSSDKSCNLNEYIVYVDVSKHFNWVKSYIDKNSIV